MFKMTEVEFKDKLQEYINRNNFWTDRTITQLGYSVNLFTTIGVAFLGYIINIRGKFPHLSFSSESEFSFILTVFYIGVFLTLLSIIFGFKAILSRLFDFRITRHLALTRKRYLLRNKKDVLNVNRTFGLLNSKIIDVSKEKTYPIFKKNFLGKTEFINESDFEEKRVIDKFNLLRKESKILGNYTWKCHRLQVAFFLFGIVAYGFITVLDY